MARQNIEIDDDDYEFIKEYKEAGFTKSLQSFVSEAIKEKRSTIELAEKLSSLNKIQ